MRYAFFVNFINNIGGSQQFCRNKLLELEKRGYDVCVLHATKGPVYINELKRFTGNFFPELRYCPNCFSKKHIQKTIEKIIKIVGTIDDETIIDCATITNLEWGEIIAKKYNCKNYGFLIDEKYTVMPGEIPFLKFKHDRKEIFGTSRDILKSIFKGYYRLSDEESYSFHPYCNNSIDNVKSDVDINRNGADYIVGCLGRLDKEYVTESMKLLSRYIAEKSDKKFKVVVIGGAKNKKYNNRLKKMFAGLKKCEIFITGNLFPIPRDLVKSFDVCISSAASAKLIACEGVPCVYVNCFSGRPVGIMNYTIELSEDQSARYYENYLDFNELMDSILIDKFCLKNEPLLNVVADDTDLALSQEIERELKDVSKENEKIYYDISSIKGSGKKFFLFSSVGRLFGGDILYKIHMKIVGRNG